MSNANADVEKVLAAAREILAHPDAGATPLHSTETLALPLRIEDPGGRFDSWFVPIVCGDEMRGYLRLSDRFVLIACSRFGQPVPASLWLDVNDIERRALRFGGAARVNASPVLSFSGSASHIAWRVSVVDRESDARDVYVAGRAVFY